ncbi:hypothetical protein PHMEG_00025529 [Phytophthora megakarya]|uniref:Uncharacterized protein n=1 Tax=Phytophthora megakarya TaxID=4795 RepID=A0A225VED2_9STRA|nr:hypothetical protein PHMEG_00025529 [Phytophthora megakarya]
MLSFTLIHAITFAFAAAIEVHIQNVSNWPSLRFDFTLKRSSMAIFGQSSFSMFANPVLSDSNSRVVYDTFATISDGSATYNYTLVDGISIISKSSVENKTMTSFTCLGSESGNLPPVNAIVTALNEATTVVESDTSTRCSSGKMYKVSINNIDFSLCTFGSSGFKLYGNDMNIAVEYMDLPVNIIIRYVDAKHRYRPAP